jgi:sulfate adenylyltransferase subunit 2
MIDFRDRMARELGFDLIVHTNTEAAKAGVTPFTHGSRYTDVMKTEALKAALSMHKFDAAFGGARRDEEKSRAKERVFSVRSAQHRWDPKMQRPELWRVYNARKNKGESLRVFPLSNWTELDIWHYIHREQIEIPSIYFAHERAVVERDGMLLSVGPEIQPKDGEKVETRMVRFRTVGDRTQTGCVESEAKDTAAIIDEIAIARVTERGATRGDDRFSEAAMEDRKKEGYF